MLYNYIPKKGCFYLKKFVSFILALILCMSMCIPASANVISPPGGDDGDNDKSPKTGSSVVAVLALTACAAGGIGAVAYKKSKE